MTSFVPEAILLYVTAHGPTEKKAWIGAIIREGGEGILPAKLCSGREFDLDF